MARVELSTRYVSATPTLDTNAYASGDFVGTVMTLTGLTQGLNTGCILSLAIVDLAAQKSALNVWLFDALPAVASADNAALDLLDAEVTKCLGHIAVGAGDYVDTASNAVATVKNINLPIKSSASGVPGTVYALIESGGSPTYAASSLTLKFCAAVDAT